MSNLGMSGLQSTECGESEGEGFHGQETPSCPGRPPRGAGGFFGVNANGGGGCASVRAFGVFSRALGCE